MILALLLAMCLHQGSAPAQQADIAREHHPWGRFLPGAWKQVRVETETFDEKGTVTGKSTTEMETVLMKVDKDSVTLRVCKVVEVAGKQFETEPETYMQGFHGELANHGLKIKELEAGSASVNGRKIPCRVLQLESAAPTNKTLTTIHYSADVAPYVLRRDSETTDPEGQNTLGKTSLSVQELNMSWNVVKTVHEHPKGTITTWSFTSTAVPGGVICHSSKELDKNRRLVRRSTLRMTDYGLEPDQERTGLFGRKRRAKPRLSTGGP